MLACHPRAPWRCAVCRSLSGCSALAFGASCALELMRVTWRSDRTFSSSMALAICPRPEFGWGRAIKALEGSVEIRQVTKTDVEGDPRNTTIGPPHVGQHAMRARQPTTQNVLRECRSLTREQFPDVAIRDPVALGDHID